MLNWGVRGAHLCQFREFGEEAEIAVVAVFEGNGWAGWRVEGVDALDVHVSNCVHQLTSLHVDEKTKVTEEVGSVVDGS